MTDNGYVKPLHFLRDLEQTKNAMYESGYEKGRTDVIRVVKHTLGELLLCAESPDYSFNHGHWDLCFTILAKYLELTDTEIYEIADKMKKGEQK